MSKFFNKIKDMRLVGLLAAAIGLTLFCVVTIKVFFSPVDIPTGTVGAFGTFMGAGLTAIFMLWKEARDRKDDSNSKSDKE